MGWRSLDVNRHRKVAFACVYVTGLGFPPSPLRASRTTRCCLAALAAHASCPRPLPSSRDRLVVEKCPSRGPDHENKSSQITSSNPFLVCMLHVRDLCMSTCLRPGPTANSVRGTLLTAGTQTVRELCASVCVAAPYVSMNTRACFRQDLVHSSF